MKSSTIAVFLCCHLVLACAEPPMAVNPKLIDEINQDRSMTWRAGVNERFVGLTLDQAKILMGSYLSSNPNHKALPQKRDLVNVSEVPDTFDARDHWKGCPGIGFIRDQSACGSCWAISVAEAFNDRYCISTQKQTPLSASDIGECCQNCGAGCSGGDPSAAWHWATSTGVVSGGEYGDKNTCKPYPFMSCAHHVVPVHGEPQCSQYDYQFDSCSKSCINGADYSGDKVKAKNAYSLNGVEQIQQDIYAYGPVTVAFSVYEDFLAYKSGVYQHKTGSMLGGHAVKVLGWGVENGTPYWLCANSWNEGWGDKGYFKIARGTNECGVEDMVNGATF